jgi:hypothetical protein
MMTMNPALVNEREQDLFEDGCMSACVEWSFHTLFASFF